MRDSWPPMRRDKLKRPPPGCGSKVYWEHFSRELGQSIVRDVVQLEPEEFAPDPWEGGTQPGWEEQEDIDE